MEYHGDLVRHPSRNYCYQVGTKFDDSGTQIAELGAKLNPEVNQYRPL